MDGRASTLTAGARRLSAPLAVRTRRLWSSTGRDLCRHGMSLARSVTSSSCEPSRIRLRSATSISRGPLQNQTDRDERGFAVTPVCALLVPEPPPPGIQAILRQAVLTAERTDALDALAPLPDDPCPAFPSFHHLARFGAAVDCLPSHTQSYHGFSETEGGVARTAPEPLAGALRP